MARSIITFIKSSNKGGILCLLCFLFCASFAKGQRLYVENNVQSKSYGNIYIRDLDPDFLDSLQKRELVYKQWITFFSVKVSGATRPMLGSYEIQDGSIVFSPRFVPDPNVAYNISFSCNPTCQPISEEISFVSLEHTSKLTLISPENDVLPANVLRFYLHFSSPMSFENPYQFIHLVDGEGNRVVEPFVEFREGLWNPDRTRLTVLIHPGRIKRGVGPNMTQGEVFQVDKSYTLFISNKWKNASGNTIGRDYFHHFTIGPAVRAKILPEEWSWSIPQSGSDQPIVIETGEILDQALAQRLINVIGTSGKEISARVSYDNKERKLLIHPKNKMEPF